MKKLLLVALACMMVVPFAVAPAAAKKKAKPIATTFYFHGHSPVGEPDGLDGATGRALTGTGYATMDTTEPSGPAPKSMTVVSYVGGPNTTCGGSFLSPVWVGKVAGTVVGDVKVTFDAISTPGGKVDVQLYPDLTAFGCDLTPAAQVRVDLPAGPGQVEAVIKGVKVPVLGSLMVQITPVTSSPYMSRVLYDSPDYPSKVEFSCVPSAGAKACV